jgi:hypothetical protein
MCIKLIVALIMLGHADAALAALPSWSPGARTRPLGPGATALLAVGSERSSIIAALLSEVDRTDVVVYVSDLMPGMPVGPTSSMVFLTSDTTGRYLLVRVDSNRLSPSERIEALGHELHHVLEVASAPEVTNAAGMAQLYRRIGWESGVGRFESGGARATGRRVWKQLTELKRAERRARAEAKAGA